MEIGKIKWAGHYNSQTGDYNNYGFITRLVNPGDVYFRKEGIRDGSELLYRFNESDDRYVVFDVVPSLRKSSQFQAVNVCFLEEVKPEELISKLSQESLASKTIRPVLLDICPEVILGDDPITYFPLLHSNEVRKAFVKKYESGEFEGCVSAALVAYLRKTKGASWNPNNWRIIDWKKEPVGDLRKLCKCAIASGVDVTELLVQIPAIWRDNKPFFRGLSFETIQAFLSHKEYTLCKEDFEYIFLTTEDEKTRELICNTVSPEWILLLPESIAYLSDKKISSLMGEINWESTDQQYINSVAPLLQRMQHVDNERIIRAIVSFIEKAWIVEDSAWWQLLTEEVRNIVLRDYKNAGLITEANATVNPLLDCFLAQYYQGDQKRDFSVQQKEAIQAVNGVTLLFAVPGSGKTTVIVARAGFMAHAMNIKANSHLIMTFSKGAAKEMKDRYERIFSDEENNMPDFRTIHSLCYSVIGFLKCKGEIFPRLLDFASGKETKEAILTQKGILQKIMFKEDDYCDEDKKTLIDNVCTLIGFIKNRMLSEEDIKRITYKADKTECPIEPIYKEYQQYLRQENLMDFDDMLYRAYCGLKENPDILTYFQDKYPYISLDEAQDTSLLQHEIVQLLVRKHGNLFMVGDDDQSIYAFRGAVPSEMLDFQKRYPQGRKLLMGINYRSDIDIVKSAERFVRVNQRRENKLMRPCSKKQGSIHLVLIPNLSAQYEYIMNDTVKCLENHEKRDDLGVLFRWNISAFPVMAYFYQNKIPFWCSKQKEAIDAVLSKQEVRRIINLLRYSRNLFSMSAFKAAWYICYRSIIRKEYLKEIEEIWKQNRNTSIANAVILFLNSHNLLSEVEAFNNAHQAILAISASTPKNAISYMMKQSEYGILSPDGRNSINTWMRVYAVLSAAEPYSSIDDFLRMIEDMQNPYGINWHESSRKICLSAMHSAKGAEFGKVIIIDTLDDITPGPEMGNDAWYDSEEERRLFYVAVTRAKRELDILEVDIYHDRHQRPSRFIGDLRAANRSVEVVNYSDNKKRSMIRFDMPHYVIRSGDFAGIYSNQEEIDEIKKRASGISVASFSSYIDAIVYMHKGDRAFKREDMCVPQDLPKELTESIWQLFGVKSIDELSAENLARIKKKTKLFMETGVTDYSCCAAEYALMYLPVNIFKVWKPFMEMIPSGRFPVDGTVKILEVGAGPGTTTLGVLLFYHELAKQYPQKEFSVDYYIIERESAFIDVINRLIRPVRLKNLKINIHSPICCDATVAIKQFAGKDIDLILESNMINPNEHIREEQLVEFIEDICKALRNYGSFLLLEPEGPEMMAYLRSIVKHANKTDSLLHEITICEHASVDLSRMQIVQDVIDKGLREKAIATHGFSYALLERKDIEGRTR